MSEFGAKEVLELAALSRLDMDEAQAAAFAPQLSRILGHLQALAQVDIEGVQAYRGPDWAQVTLRKDDACESTPRELALANVPDHDGEHVLVPQFKDES